VLQRVDLATNLVWKPDGKQQAYISQPAGSQPSFSLVVVDVESGEVVSQQENDVIISHEAEVSFEVVLTRIKAPLPARGNGLRQPYLLERVERLVYV
jgi:hypothetical protein